MPEERDHRQHRPPQPRDAEGQDCRLISSLQDRDSLVLIEESLSLFYIHILIQEAMENHLFHQFRHYISSHPKLFNCPVMLLLFDAIIIIYFFFCPVHSQDGLTVLFFALFCGAINAVISLFLFFAKKEVCSLVFLFNTLVLPIAMFMAAWLSTWLALKLGMFE
jgi:hypothetical protein